MTENEDDERDGDTKHRTSSRYLRIRTDTTPQKSNFAKGGKSLETFSFAEA